MTTKAAKFKVGDEVIICGGKYKYSREGSYGKVVDFYGGKSVEVSFDYLTGPQNLNKPWIFPIDPDNLKENELAKSPLWKALT